MKKESIGVKRIEWLTAVLNEEEWTTAHEERVMNICQAFGVALDLTPDAIEDLMTVGMIHDIGKIKVPKDILNKPGALSPSEYEEMKRHTRYGYDLLKDTVEYTHMAQSVLHHHEHYDGRGYPLGLKAEEIPLHARIVTIVDAYDAMTSERPYAKAKTITEALTELRKEAGKQFDPDLVHLFIKEIHPSVEGNEL